MPRLTPPDVQVPPGGGNVQRIGTAFDYALRYGLRARGDARHHGRTVAETAVERVIPLLGFHRQEEGRERLTAAVATLEALDDGPLSDAAADACLDLAALDWVYRGRSLKSLDAVPVPHERAELQRLYEIVPWGEFTGQGAAVLNPRFGEGSQLVGGADADLLIAGTVIDIKTTKSTSMKVDYARQLVGYAVLAEEYGVSGVGRPEIHQVGLYFSRAGTLHTWALDDLMSPSARREFGEHLRHRVGQGAEAIGRRGLAVHIVGETGGGMADKKAQNETEICQNYITPAIVAAGWDKHTQVRREFSFTAGQVIVRGKLASRGKQKRADYLLFHSANLPLAIVEAKDNKHAVGAGMPQALDYAATLDVPFVFSSNGDGFLFHDRTGGFAKPEVELALDEFPSPAALWTRYRAWKGLDADAEKLARQPYHEDPGGKEPRYYQRIAVQRVVEAVAEGQRRVLVVMATGTGKTYTVFQIIWRLWKAERVKRVLFLVDRNILADQTITNDFKPFGSVMTKVRDRNMDPAYEVYLALYQAVTGNEEEKNVYKQFSPDFFDLVVIDECHRGSAREDSAWREILDYFEPAIQLGLTATPKETKEVSTLTYFGEPVYEYSLKQGIADGFLAPYKVVRIDLDRDLQGWRPRSGQTDDHGHEIEDRVYNQRDMDRSLVLKERTRRVAEKVVAYLLGTDPYGKTIVFCEDIEHAERMRSALANEVAARMPKEAGNTAKFIVRITGDNEAGKRELDNFIHPERRYPVIATTSKLLTTGVDAKTCKLIVLDQRIQSMIEFKQIVGRGTRIHEDAGKLWFTIMDFKKATELFADPEFDGEPVIIYEPGGGETPVPPGGEEGGDGPPPEPPPGVRKYVVSGVPVQVVAERVQYYGPDGKLITESLTDYTKKTVRERYATLDDFLRRWTEADRKAVVIDELREQGVLLEELRDHVKADMDAFDLICHVVFGQPPLTRRERAESVKKRDVFTKYGPQARAVLDALLDKYADEGLGPVEDLGVLRVQPLSGLGTPVQLIKHFGGKKGYLAAVRELEAELYAGEGAG